MAVAVFAIAIALRTIWRLAAQAFFWLIRGLIALCLGMLVGLATQQLLVPSYPALDGAGVWIGTLVAAITLLGFAAWHRTSDDFSFVPVQLTDEDKFVVPAIESPAAAAKPRQWKHVAYFWSRDARAARALAKVDAARAKAWSRIEAEADWAPSQIAVARRSCEAFLAASAGTQDFELVGFAVALRKRIPELVDEAIAACDGRSPTERRLALDEAVDMLEQLGAEADRKRARITTLQHSNFATTRTYVETLTKRDQLFH